MRHIVDMFSQRRYSLVPRSSPRRLLVVERPVWLICIAFAVMGVAKDLWLRLIRWLLNAGGAFVLLLAVGCASYGVTVGAAHAVGNKTAMLLGMATFIVALMAMMASETPDEDARLVLSIPVLLTTPIWSVPSLLLFGLAAAMAGLVLSLAVLCIPLALVGGVMGLGGSLYGWWRKRFRGVTLRCTQGACTFRDVQLAYLCPGCHTRYTYLLPSHFGLLSHRCSCGGRLPTITALGREQLTTCCPACGHTWMHGTEARPEFFLALVGGVATGKTCFLTMMVQALMDLNNARCERTIDRDGHDTRYGTLKQGRLPPPTQRGVPEAVVLSLADAGNAGARWYLYDASGEEYSTLERPQEEEFVFFRDLSGIVLLVDPLSLPRVRPQLDLRDPGIWHISHGSETPLEDVVASLCYNVRRFLKYGRSGRTYVPLAVVINKADIPEVCHRLRMTADRGQDRSEHDICRQALVDWGAGREVATLEHEFVSIRYFSCSTLGRIPDNSGRPFRSDGILDPLRWLAGRENAGRKTAFLHRLLDGGGA
jgi:hypothetical protein